MSNSIKFTLPKKLRLLTPLHFSYVFQMPLVVNFLQITVFSRSNLLGYPRIGLTVAKKNIKFAHERNRIKRLIRESFRLNQHKLPSIDFIIIVNRKISNCNNNNILKLLEKLWFRYC